MSKRVFGELAKWVTATDAELTKILAKLSGKDPSPDEMRLARRLFAIAIETPGGLKVQTIHAFCERLLQRFSLEADVPPGFAILDDQEKSELLREAVDKVLTESDAARRRGDAARPAPCATRCASRPKSSFDDLLSEALRAATGSRPSAKRPKARPACARQMPFTARAGHRAWRHAGRRRRRSGRHRHGSRTQGRPRHLCRQQQEDGSGLRRVHRQDPARERPALAYPGAVRVLPHAEARTPASMMTRGSPRSSRTSTCASNRRR